MLANTAVRAVRKPAAMARLANSSGTGWSATTTASPPSSWAASRLRPRSMRSAKKATAVSAATASTTASKRKRMLPARRSRRVWTRAQRQADTETAAEVAGKEGLGDTGMWTKARGLAQRGGT